MIKILKYDFLYIYVYYLLIILDYRFVVEIVNELMRFFLYEFLESVYENYDIVIWCKYLKL